jgi:uncharacterized protein
MRDAILSCLGQIEKQQGVKILYACESGSRAWGFPSADSDYDVRFLYVHPLDWYLSVEKQRDVIEVPVDAVLDITGWDLRKALGLFRKSNPPLMEWLASPVVYRETSSLASRLRALREAYYLPFSCLHHYLSMANRHAGQVMGKERIKTKEYFYILRPLLAVEWIERGYGVAPTEFKALLEKLVDNTALMTAILRVITDKRQETEKDTRPPEPLILDYIERELARLQEAQNHFTQRENPSAELDEIFRSTLREVWKE